LVAIRNRSNDSCAIINPPLVFSFGVNGKTKILHPDGSGSSSTTPCIFSGVKASLVDVL
jgi:hypothetical protein